MDEGMCPWCDWLDWEPADMAEAGRNLCDYHFAMYERELA